MGVMNHEGSLFLASGIDNSGLAKGKQEAIGIVRTMMKQVSSFDVFAGIGLSAATAFAIAGKQAYEFEKKFETSMLEVATLSDIVSGSLDTYKQKIVDLTTSSQIPIYADEAAKALYQIVSAGHDGADGMIILEASAKAAVGGVTDTATAADAITSIMNAYGKSAKDADRISDMLFTTVKLGKTTMGELGKSISQVTALAASFDVEIEEVLAAISTLTSSGTPTAMAMTQIKQALIQANAELGDGAFKTRTFQEGLNEIMEKANGSESALNALIPSVEAVNGILGLTGIKAEKSANDLYAISNAAGAADEAFKLMAESTENQLKLLTNNITASLRPLGKGILKEVSTISKGLNDAFASGDLENVLKTIKALLITGAAAWGSYTVAIALNKIARQAYNSVAVMDIATKTTNLALTKANTVAIIKQTLAQAKSNVVAMLNPYTAIAASIALLTYTIYKHVTALSAQEIAQKKVNERYDEQKRKIEDERSSVESLIETIKDETKTRYDKQKALTTLQSLYPDIFSNLDMEEVKNLNLTDTIKMLNIELEKRNNLQNEQNLKSSKELLNKKDGSFRWSMDERGEALELMGEKNSYANRLAFFTSGMDDAFKEYVKKSEEAEKQRKEIAEKAYGETENDAKEVFEDINKRVSETKKNISSLEKDLANLRSGKAQSSNLEADITAKEEALKKANDTLKTLTGIDESKNKDKVDASKQGIIDAKMSLENAAAERKLSIRQAELEISQSRIDMMENGFAKQQEQTDINHEKELLSIQKRTKELIEAQQKIEREEWKVNGSKGLFAPSTNNASNLPEDDQKELKDRSDAAWATYNKNQQRNLDSLLEQYRTYEEERIKIIKKYDAERTSLSSENIDGKFDKNIEELNKKEREELAQFDTMVQDKTSILTRMFADMSEKSIVELKAIRDEAEKLWDFLSSGEWDSDLGLSLDITKEQFEDIIADPSKMSKFKKGVDDIRESIYQLDKPINQIKEGLKELFDPKITDSNKQLQALNKIQKGYEKYSAAISLVSGAMGELGELADSEVLSSIASGLDGVLSIANDAMAGAQAGAAFGPAGMAVGAALGALKGVFGAINKIREANALVLKELRDNQRQEYLGQLEIEQIWRQKYEWAKKIGEVTLKHIAREGEELKRQSVENAKMQEDLWAKIYKQEYKTREFIRSYPWLSFKSDKLITEWGSLAGKTFEEIETLVQQNKLSEEAMKYYELLKKAKEEGKDLESMQLEYLEKMRELTTGSTYGNIVSGIVDGFKQGKRSAADFASSFEQLMQGAIESSLSLLADEKTRKWYEDFAKAGEDGYTKEELEQLKKDWIKLNENLAEDAKRLEDVTGVTLGDSNKSGVTGELKAEMSEGTGSQLVGLWNMTAMDLRAIKEYITQFGFNDISKELNHLLNELNDIKVNTGKTADNTAYTEEGFKKLEDKLDKIEKNTKQNNSRL